MTVLETFLHWFTPHQSNNHRAKALHVDTLFAYVLILAVFNLGIRFLHHSLPDVLGYATDIHVEQLLAGTNSKRQESGLGPLQLNGQLSAAAAKKAADMFAKGYWAHNSPDGATPWNFISGSGYRYTVAGENLAKNFSTSGAVVDAWMASPTHRDNILKASYRDIGFAVVNGNLAGEETTLVVQMFGATINPVSQVVAAAPTAIPTIVPSPVVVSKAAAQTEDSQQPIVTSGPTPAPTAIPRAAIASAGVTKQPVINITAVTRNMIFVFVGVLLGALAVDGWLVARRRVVRIAGRNIAHIFFLTAILIAASTLTRGSLL